MGRKVWFPVVSGPLAPFAAGFESWLRSRAYSPSATADRLCQFDQLSRWLDSEGLGVGELTDEQAERFVAARRARGAGDMGGARRAWRCRWGICASWGWCRHRCRWSRRGRWRSCWPITAAICWSSVRSASTRCSDAYEPAARLFLAGREGPDGLGLERLTAADVSCVLGARVPAAERVGRAGSGVRAAVVLRYLHLAGLIEVPLVWAVPSVADLRDRTLPRGLEPAAIKKLSGQLRSAHGGRPA